MKDILAPLMNRSRLVGFFISVSCLTACNLKQIPIASISENQMFLRYQLVNLKLLPDVVIEKFDSSVKKLWADELSKNKNFILVKSPDDSAVEETYLDDTEFNLLKRGHTYKLRQHYQISESGNPILPNILRKLNQGKATRAEIVYSAVGAKPGDSVMEESFNSEFTADNVFLSAEGHQITPSNTAFFTDMMANASSRGYKLDPLDQLKSNFKSIDLQRSFVTVSLERSFLLKLRSKEKEAAASEKLLEITLNITFLRNFNRFANPVYHVSVGLLAQKPEMNSDLMRFSEKVRAVLLEHKIEAKKVTSLDSAGQLYRQLKNL